MCYKCGEVLAWVPGEGSKVRPAQGRRLGVSTALTSVHLQAATTATTISTRCYEEVRRTYFFISSRRLGNAGEGRGVGVEAWSLASPDGSSRAGANPWPEGVVTMATFTRFGEECEAKHAWVWACVVWATGEGAPLAQY